MTAAYGPVGTYGGGAGYPAPLKGYTGPLSSGERWAKPRPAPVIDDTRCEIVWYGIRYVLPPRATVKVNASTGTAYVRAGGEIFELVDGGRVMVSAERHRLLLEQWDSL